MNKADLIAVLSEKTTLGKDQVEKVLTAFEEVIIASLQSGQEVTLTGFGTFLAKKREARMAVNPRNPSEKINVPAVTVPKFKAGKNLKDALKNSAAEPTH